MWTYGRMDVWMYGYMDIMDTWMYGYVDMDVQVVPCSI